MRSTVATPATANVGPVRLSAAEGRARMQAGSGLATLSKKLATRRSEMVVGLMPAGGGMDKPLPERAWFPRVAAGDEAHTLAMNQYVDKEIGGGIKQVRASARLWLGLRSSLARSGDAGEAQAQAGEQHEWQL